MVSEPLATTPNGVDEDAWAAACAAVRAYCGWHVAPSVTETVTVDGSGSNIQVLPTLHLTELVSITNGGSTVSDPEWSESGVVRGCWTSKFRGVVAEMTHGYEDCPPEVARVIGEMVAAGGGGAKSVTSGPHSVTFEPSLTAQQRSILDLYRRPALA